MEDNCYSNATDDTNATNACNLFESDLLELVWEELNFAHLIDY